MVSFTVGAMTCVLGFQVIGDGETVLMIWKDGSKSFAGVGKTSWLGKTTHMYWLHYDWVGWYHNQIDLMVCVAMILQVVCSDGKQVMIQVWGVGVFQIYMAKNSLRKTSASFIQDGSKMWAKVECDACHIFRVLKNIQVDLTSTGSLQEAKNKANVDICWVFLFPVSLNLKKI